MKELVAAVDALVASLPGEVGGELLMDTVSELETQIRRLQGFQLTCLERVDRSGAAAAQHVTTAAWLRQRHRLSSSDAHRRVHLSRDLADSMPRMRDALTAGEVGVEHAQAGARLRKVAGDDQMRKADSALTDAARRMDPVELRGWVTAAIHSLSPERIVEDEATAYDERELACDAKVARIITGPAGEILDAGRASRTFTTAARRAVVARDRQCIWEGCNVPAAWCEVHHGIHWVADRGPSDVDNGNLLCGRHHDLVHHRGHSIRIHRDGRRTVDASYDPWRRRIIDERINPEPGCCDQQAEPP